MAKKTTAFYGTQETGGRREDGVSSVGWKQCRNFMFGEV